MKLRGSYGTTGNTSVNNSMTYMSWSTSPAWVYGGMYNVNVGSLVGPLGSNGLKWETTANLDLGFDYGLFDNRINGSFAWYTQDISDLILSANVQPSVGYANTQIYENVGDLKNWGFEFNISSVNIEKRGFVWKTDFNISTNKNKVKALNDTEKGKGAINDNNNTIRKEGEALNTYYMCNSMGVDPEKGIYMIEQINADLWNNEFRTETTGTIIPATTTNVANNRMIQHGKTDLPKFYGGMVNSFFYKGFDLYVQFNYAGGHYLRSMLHNECDRMITEVNAIRDMVGNTWEKPGDKAKYPQLMGDHSYYYDNDGNPSPTRTTFGERRFTTVYLFKGDYLRLRILQLGYTLPSSVLGKNNLHSLRFYIGGSNLLTFTKFKGLDPETLGELPIPQTFNFGISLNL